MTTSSSLRRGSSGPDRFHVNSIPGRFVRGLGAVFGRHTLYFSLSSVYRVSIQLQGCIAYPIVQKHTLGEGSAHDHAAHAGRSIEVLLAALSPAGVEVGVDLRHRGGVVDGGGGWSVSSLSSSSRRQDSEHSRSRTIRFEKCDCSNLRQVLGVGQDPLVSGLSDKLPARRTLRSRIRSGAALEKTNAPGRSVTRTDLTHTIP